jgi:hypothetical protein
MKVYVISRDYLADFLNEKGMADVAEENLSDDGFKEACEELGWTMTLEDFQRAWNDENCLSIPRYDYDYIRFLD